MAEIPERIGPYRVLSVVGEGGMGVVYKAEDQRLERVVALKVIREFEGDASRRSRFWQEARAAAQVAHPNACRIYDIAEVQDRLVLVMEFIEENRWRGAWSAVPCQRKRRGRLRWRCSPRWKRFIR